MTSHLAAVTLTDGIGFDDLVAWLAGMATIRVAGAAFTALAELDAAIRDAEV